MTAIKSASEASVSEQRIRELAYQIWETEGCPNGQSERHWNMARKLAEIEIREEPKPAARARRINKPKAATLADMSNASDAPIILPPPQAQKPQPQARPRTSRNKLDA
jgi:hypothetical protein